MSRSMSVRTPWTSETTWMVFCLVKGPAPERCARWDTLIPVEEFLSPFLADSLFDFIKEWRWELSGILLECSCCFDIGFRSVIDLWPIFFLFINCGNSCTLLEESCRIVGGLFLTACIFSSGVTSVVFSGWSTESINEEAWIVSSSLGLDPVPTLLDGMDTRGRTARFHLELLELLFVSVPVSRQLILGDSSTKLIWRICLSSRTDCLISVFGSNVTITFWCWSCCNFCFSFSSSRCFNSFKRWNKGRPAPITSC